MKKFTKILCVVLSVVLVAMLFASCEKEPEANPNAQSTVPLVVGYSPFSEKFSPFFATTSYDVDVASMTQVGLLTTDRLGGIIYNAIDGETVSYNGTDYTYKGISNITVVRDEAANTTTYNIEIRKDLKFSDGEKLTADDIIFTYYVLADPTYDGASSIYSYGIQGMDAYRANMAAKGALIVAAGEANTTYTYWTQEEQAAYWTAFWAAGTAFAQEIVDYCTAGYGATSVAEAAAMWAFGGLPADATALDFFKVVVEAYDWDTVEMSSVESAGSAFGDLLAAELGDSAAAYQAGVATGERAATISGITKVNNYEVQVVTDGFSAPAIYSICGIEVAPMHYYGDESLYNYKQNKFGFTTGDLSGVRAKTTQPLGAGAYKFVEYKDNVVYFEANNYYYKGAPITTYIQFKETNDADMLAGITTGTIDAGEFSLTTARINEVKSYNSNGETDGDVINLSMVDFLGYGYMGICATAVNVGGVSDSDASKNFRKGFATLLAVYRDVAIDSYYGERASVINYPMSNTSWATPQATDEDYQLAFSVDVDGNDIYTSTMTADEKYAAALKAAIGFFKAAGCTWDEAAGKFTAAPEGAKLEYEFMIPGDGIGDHPNFAIVNETANALATIGFTLKINDLSNSDVLWDALDAGTAEFWTAAWGATIDPDMYQVYYSTNIVGAGGTDSNHYRITDDELDDLIMAARESADQTYRKTAYKACLDIIMDWAVEIPSYQRQECVIFSSERVKLETLTPDITTFWGWMSEIEKLEVNVA